MKVSFIREDSPLTGLVLLNSELDVIPNKGDRVKILTDTYFVNDITFNLGHHNQSYVYIYLKKQK